MIETKKQKNTKLPGIILIGTGLACLLVVAVTLAGFGYTLAPLYVFSVFAAPMLIIPGIALLIPSLNYTPLSLSIGFLVARVILSLYAYSQMLWGSGPWAEGRAWNALYGLGNILWLIVCLILNLVSIKKVSKKQKTIAWVLFSAVALLTVLILTFRP